MSINKYIQILLQPVSVFLYRNAEDFFIHPSQKVPWSSDVQSSGSNVNILAGPNGRKGVEIPKLVGGFHKFDSLSLSAKFHPLKKRSRTN